jgi:hypothetical protein
MDTMVYWDYMVDCYKEKLAGLGEHVEGEDPKTTSGRQKIRRKLEEAEASKAAYSSSTATPPARGPWSASAFWDTSSMPLLFPSVPATASLPKIGLSLSSTAASSTGALSEATLFISVRFDLSR